MAKRTNILPEPSDPSQVVGLPQPPSIPKAKHPKRPKPVHNEPTIVVALCDLFDGIRYRRRGEEFVWNGPIPKNLEQRLAPEGTRLDDDDAAAPGAPEGYRGHRKPQTWTTQGHPDLIAARGGND